MADYGKRKCKMCSKVFSKRAPLSMFCSYDCNYSYQNKSKPAANKKSKPIKKFSNQRAKRHAAYLLSNRLFLDKEENKFCPVMSYLYNKTVRATQVHHTNGREGERLNDQEYWLPVSDEGHKWIHSNHELSYEQGWLTKKYIKENGKS